MGRKRRKTFNFLPKKEKIWKNRCNFCDAMIYWACHAIEYFSVIQACVFPLGKNTCSFRILVWQIMWIAWQHRACIFRARRVRCAAHFCKNCVWRNCFERTVLVDSGRRTACCFMVSFRGISAVSGQGNRYQNGNWKILKCVWTPVLAEKAETPAVEADSDCAFICPAVEIRIEYRNVVFYAIDALI